jgi:hypothetical protein
LAQRACAALQILGAVPIVIVTVIAELCAERLKSGAYASHHANVGCDVRREVAIGDNEVHKIAVLHVGAIGRGDGGDVAGNLHTSDVRRREPGGQVSLAQAVYPDDLGEVVNRQRFSHSHRA